MIEALQLLLYVISSQLKSDVLISLESFEMKQMIKPISGVNHILIIPPPRAVLEVA